MANNNMKALNDSIKKKKYHWSAGPTSVSELSSEAQKSLLGLHVSDAELKANEKAIESANELMAFRAPVSAPASIDWRNKGGDWTTSIKNQSSCGSCVSFAVAATIESAINIKCNNAGLDKDLSEAHLFYCGCGNCCSTGWGFSSALDFCKNTGIALETSFPYTPGNQPCNTAVTPYIKLTGWSQTLSIADRKNMLSTKGPMVAGMAVYQDFYSYNTGVYRHTSGSLVGYHAISVVGYDDADECWICKNSWGTGWGDNGWFKIGYGECSLDTSFAFYGVDLVCPQPVDLCRRYLPYLINVLRASMVNSRLRTCLLYYVCGRKPFPFPVLKCSASHIRVAKRVRLILLRCPKYRKGFCNALLKR